MLPLFSFFDTLSRTRYISFYSFCNIVYPIPRFPLDGLGNIAFFSLCGYAGLRGYGMYKNAIEKEPIDEKFVKIMEDENYCETDEVPQIFLDAIIAVEDRRFYQHKGIDMISIGRAVIVDFITRDFTEGGSTITQQITKNEYFTQNKNFYRKIAEAFVAKDIENEYSKDEILEIYYNTNYYGNGYYGVYDACHGYFGKDPIDMTDDGLVIDVRLVQL